MRWLFAYEWLKDLRDLDRNIRAELSVLPGEYDRLSKQKLGWRVSSYANDNRAESAPLISYPSPVAPPSFIDAEPPRRSERALTHALPKIIFVNPECPPQCEAKTKKI